MTYLPSATERSLTMRLFNTTKKRTSKKKQRSVGILLDENAAMKSCNISPGTQRRFIWCCFRRSLSTPLPFAFVAICRNSFGAIIHWFSKYWERLISIKEIKDKKWQFCQYQPSIMPGVDQPEAIGCLLANQWSQPVKPYHCTFKFYFPSKHEWS